MRTDFSCDLLGRVIQAGAYGAAGSSQFAYNTLGWKLRIQDADLFSTSYEYDEVGRMVKETTAGNVTCPASSFLDTFPPK
jgi:YD repeat-containing protein